MKKKKILLKADAIAQGKLVFFTGKKCRDGHIANRYVSNGRCIECIRLARLAEKEAIKAGRLRKADK
jgi:hypothetical protein